MTAWARATDCCQSARLIAIPSRLAVLLVCQLCACTHHGARTTGSAPAGDSAASSLQSLTSRPGQPPHGRVIYAPEVAAMAVAAAQHDPTSAQRNYAAGSDLLMADDPDAALPYLQKAVALDRPPSSVSAFAHALIGEVNFIRGNYADAGSEIDQALAIDPANAPARYDHIMLGYDSVYRTWTTVESAHLRIHMSPLAAVSNASEFTAAREAACRAILKVFSPSAESGKTKKIDLFVWSSLEEVGHAALPVLPSYPSPRFRVAHVLVSQPPGHELAHVISDRAAHPITANGMVYYGVGVMFDQPGRDLLADARRAVHAAGVSGVDMRAMWGGWPFRADSVNVSVAAAFLTEILRRGGRERFLILLHDPRLETADALYGPELQRWIDDFQKELIAQ